MFEHKIPKFASQRVLSREILFALRDISYQEQLIQYADYSDGIVAGCELFERNMTIGVKNGIIKYAGRLYVLQKAEGIPYQPTEEWVMLKIRFGPQKASLDFDSYTGEMVLDSGTQVQSNEVELGRFKLKKGSCLRTRYIDFHDMDTEYDTVNLLYVPQAAKREATLHPAITEQFAREAYPFLKDNLLDINFCGHCLANSLPVSRDFLQIYICGRMKKEEGPIENVQMYQYLSDILKAIKSGGTLDARKRPADDTILLV